MQRLRNWLHAKVLSEFVYTLTLLLVNLAYNHITKYANPLLSSKKLKDQTQSFVFLSEHHGFISDAMN